jgi:hypothetical protein
MIPKTEAITQFYRTSELRGRHLVIFQNTLTINTQQAEDSTICCSPYSTSILELAQTRMKT